jgi:hypothetical protein
MVVSLIEMSESHKRSMQDHYLAAIKLNDIDCESELLKIRKRATELGYTADQVTDVFRSARHDRD